MKKLTKLLLLSGLVTSFLTGCSFGGNGEEEVVKTLESLKVTAQPTKTSYYQGEAFEAAGLEVKAVYNTGEEPLEASAYTLSGFDSSTAGQKTITVTYEGKTVTFTVNVIGKNGLSIDHLPNKLRYKVGEELDLKGLVVSQKYADNTSKQLSAADYTVTGFSSEEAGPVTLTITAAGDTATIALKVYPADWSVTEKALMNDEDKLSLFFELPYDAGLAFGVDGLKEQPDDDEYAVMWGVAVSDYVATDPDIDAYADVLEKSAKSGMKSAWQEYAVGTGDYTEDLEYMGYDTDAPVYQYYRPYKDSSSANAFQIVTIGVDLESYLYVATTVVLAPFADEFNGVYLNYLAGTQDGKAFNDMEGFWRPVMDYLNQIGFEAPATATIFDAVEFPTITGLTYTKAAGITAEGTMAAFIDSAVVMPYLSGNVLSDYYGHEFTIIFSNHKLAAAQAYTQADVDALVKVYTDAGLEATTEKDGSKTLEIEGHNGFDFEINYDYYQPFIYITVGATDFELPFEANHQICTLLEANKYDETGLYFYSVGYDKTFEAPFYDIDSELVVDDDPTSPSYGSCEVMEVVVGLDDKEEMTDISLEDAADGFVALIESSDMNIELLTDPVEIPEYFIPGAKLNGVDIDPVYDYDDNAFLFSDDDYDYAIAYNSSYDHLNLTATPVTGSTARAYAVSFDLATEYTKAESTSSMAGTYAHTEGSGDEAVTTTLVLGEFDPDVTVRVVEIDVYFMIFDEDNHNGIFCQASFFSYYGFTVMDIEVMPATQLFYPYDTWAEASAHLWNLMTQGNNYTDELPATWAPEGATAFNVDMYLEGLTVEFDTAAHAAANGLDGVLTTAGFVKGMKINGVQLYVSANDEYALGICDLEEEDTTLVVLYFEGMSYFMLFADACEPLEDEGFVIPQTTDMGMAHLVEFNAYIDENGKGIYEFTYDDAANTTSPSQSLETELLAAGFVPDANNAGVLVKDGISVTVSVEGAVITVTFTPAPAPEAPAQA